MSQFKSETNPDTKVRNAKHVGETAYYSGLVAEDQAAAEYARRGVVVLHRRWRGQGGEIDLVLRDGKEIVFAEVKKARSLQAAMERLRPAQMQRIYSAASEYLAHTPDGQLSPTRFDLVVLNDQGHIEVIKNAFGHF
ncbi:YraN family protein [Roseovarius sp. EL26]|uniref:YraN family protein n=1 Tax=Roseovarius sp. EL26 TaxID=2126672 RepID=UPI0020B10E97|nr:YraN family protein [Roseovarius sp. EL26]